MTDASKRRQEESPERNVRAVSYQGGMSQGEVPVPKSSMPMMPLMVPQMKFGVTRRGTPVMLPPGIPDVDT